MNLQLFLQRYSILIAVLIIEGLFAILVPNFFSARNIHSILIQFAVLGIVVGGVVPVMISGGLDLSVGGIVAWSGIFLAFLLQANVFGDASPVGIAALVILFGAAIGLLNGLAVTVIGMPSFIVTLATLSITRGGAALLYAVGFEGQILGPAIRHPTFLGLGSGSLGPLPLLFVMLVPVAVILQIAVSRSLWGLRLYAVGGSELAARVAGIRTSSLQISTYVLSGALAALAGIAVSSWVGHGSPESAFGMEFESIAAFVLGGGILFAGTGSIYGGLLGALVITGLRNGLSLANVASPYQWMVIGGVFLAAVGVERFSRSRQGLTVKLKLK